MAKAAKFHLYCGAGEEKSIAATKTFTSQMMILALLAAKWSGNKDFLAALNNVPAKVCEAIESLDASLGEFAEKYQNMPGAVILGRGVSYCIALEGALKMLETNKIKMKGYPTSDFHHGPIAQLHAGDPVFVVSPKGVTFDDELEITEKLKGVNADILFITDDTENAPEGVTVISVPNTSCELTAPFVSVLVFQILACKMTIVRGIDPDKAGVINKITITK
jgi:glucosamine--fructose-6-phosphate aminotransferase (isomerizing)